MDDKLILTELEKLIKKGNELKEKLWTSASLPHGNNVNYYQFCERWKGKSLNLLKLRFGEDSDYYRDFKNNINQTIRGATGGLYYEENVGKGTGVLEYVYHALKTGLTDDLFYKKEILLMSDLLDQAFEFLSKGHKLAAAIYGRVVLEITVKEYATKNGISQAKFDQTIIKLRQTGHIMKPFETSLRANYQLGSSAVHGEKEFAEHTDKDIKEYLGFIRDKVLNLE